ncbi:MAG: hypothetical protein H9W81_12875 [Enterococcus sp.]|nr:hypothetical protein [Enterococcus sp.]
MIKTKMLLSVTLASAFLLAGCSSDETPKLSLPSAAATSSATSNPSNSDDGDKDSGSKITDVDGKKIESFNGMTPMPDDGVLSAEEQAEWLKSENARIAKENDSKPVTSVSVDSTVKNQAIDLYNAYASSIKEGDYEKACTYIFPGEGKTLGDCLAHYESLGEDFNPDFDFANSNSLKMTSTGDVIFQQQNVPSEGETIPRLKFVERDGKLLLSVPVG